jgi:subtilisin-like proprotein convertase family protein
VYLIANLGTVTPPAQVIYTSAGPVPILDDAVTTDSIYVSADQTISSVDVALRVDHPRVSDLVFHLISPDGTRVLLVENRGGTTTSGMGGTIAVTNIVPVSSSGSSGATTNVINVAVDTGTLSIYYNFYSLPDEMVVYDQGGNLIFNSGMISGSGVFNVAYVNSSFLTIVMNPPSANNNEGPGDFWDYTVSALQARQTYLVLTENTNLTTTPIKFAPPPFVPVIPVTTNNVFSDGFEGAAAGDYVAGVSSNFDSWAVTANQVTVISNATLAYSGTNLLALADGTISRILPTVPGQMYTLSYAYRGPGIVSLWRGENNGADSISNNPGIPSNITYSNGVVGTAFVFNGSSSQVWAPASASLNVGTNNIGLTMETWVNPDSANIDNLQELIQWNLSSGSGSGPIGIHLEISDNFDADLYVNLFDTSQNFHQLWSAAGVMTGNSFQHVAATYDKNTRRAVLYRNGVLLATTNYGTSFTPQTSYDLFLGTRPAGAFANHFKGLLDEPSIYNRPLSASEIKAIYNQGSAGKYNTNAPSIAQGLAEAQVTLNGAPQPIFFGNNTSWQTATYSFIATQTNTPLQITGIEPGMLLDNFVMTQIPTNNYDLYYLPEESLDLLQGEDALGQWTLEIQDDRVGATNPAPSLVSWQLRFNFPYTPPTITTLTNGQAATNNTVPPGGIAYYLIQVPTNADMSTNILFSTTGPLNLLFDAFNPPTGILPTDYLILSSPIPGGSAILTTTSVPTNFAAGGTYYLGVQNPNSFSVNYGIQVNFHLLPPPLALPQLPELLAIANQLFTVTNSATGGFGPMAYTLTSSVTNGPAPAIGLGTGIITWTPATSQAPAVYTLTNIVTDTATLLTATDIFHVLVVLTNGLPAFPGAEGAGGFAIGGRGGDVYHVVNLNDSGPGSLRNGITSTFGSRTIVFDVSGAINLYSPLKINNPYITIAGQTAPGAGITIQGLTTSVENSHDMVVRFLRCRPGDIYEPFFQDDSFHFRGVTNSIADHISASWSIDEVLSTTYSTNISVQWSMIAEPLNHSAHLMDNGGPGFQAHGYGSLIRYGSGAVSYHHNLYADNYSRNPRPGDNIRLDFINNVVCNWGIFAGYNEDDAADNPAGYTNFLNYIGNYFIAGSNTTANPNIAFASGVPDPTFTQIYQATNFIDTNAFNIVLDGTDTGWGMFSGLLTQLGSPTPMPEIQVTTNSPAFAYEQVLAFAGASVAGVTAAGTPAAGTSLLRDPVDTNIITNVRNKSGQIIDFISSNSFPGVYLSTNFGMTYGGYSNAASYWVGQGLTNFVGVNPWPVLDSAPQPLDSDGDGLPDYWEITLAATGVTSMNPAVPNNNHSNPDGYTDLEHYINWLAAPHALTISNTPVAVDLYALVGLTGNLSFGVTNGTNGIVTLGTDGHTATFMPTNNYFGFASFGFSVTNLATANGFGPVTVSVMVSVTNITTSSLPLTNAVPQTNTVPAGSITYYLVTVPVYAQFATNILWYATPGPVNLLFSQVGFPTGTNTGDYFLLTNSVGGISLLGITTNSMPTNIIPGGTYYLGVQNTNVFPVNFAIEVDFYPPPPVPPSPGGPISINSITATNIGGKFGFLLTWFAPTNDLFRVQWTGSLMPTIMWNTFSNIVAYTGPPTPTNGLFTFFDDGSQTGGFGPMRFYRLILLQSLTNGVPQTNSVSAGGVDYFLINVPTNADFATNLLLSATGPVNLLFNQTTLPTGTNAGDYTLLAGATNGISVLSTTSVPTNIVPGGSYWLGVQNTNSFTVSFGLEVDFHLTSTNAPTSPIIISGIIYTNIGGTNGFLFTWYAPTNDLFRVQWTTNLAPPVAWNMFTNLIRYTGPVTPTNGLFSFFDDGSQSGGLGSMRFYRLLQVQSANFLTLPSQTNLTVNPLTPLIVTNTATDSDTNATLAYGLAGAPAGAAISTNGIITWTPAVAQASTTNTFTTVVTDNGVPPAQATNSFTVTVGPPPPVISSVTLMTNGLFQLTWFAPTNYQFQVEWATNLVSPIVWNYIPPVPPWLTSGTTNFTFVDTNAAVQMKFYRLIQQYP